MIVKIIEGDILFFERTFSKSAREIRLFDCPRQEEMLQCFRYSMKNERVGKR